jgi:hypothetical protein
MQINGKNLEVLRVALERALADVHTDRQHIPMVDQGDLIEERITYQNLLIRVRAAIERGSK